MMIGRSRSLQASSVVKAVDDRFMPAAGERDDLGREDEKDEHHGEKKGVHGAVPGLQLQEGQFRPFGAHRRTEIFICDALEQPDGGARADACPRRASRMPHKWNESSD
jgi:hypothetical protein